MHICNANDNTAYRTKTCTQRRSRTDVGRERTSGEVSRKENCHPLSRGFRARTRSLSLSLSFFSQPPLALPPPRMDLIIGWTTSMKLFAISVICSDLSRLGDFTARFIGIISRSRDGAYCIAPLPERDAVAFYYCRLTYFYRCCPRKKSRL